MVTDKPGVRLLQANPHRCLLVPHPWVTGATTSLGFAFLISKLVEMAIQICTSEVQGGTNCLAYSRVSGT